MKCKEGFRISKNYCNTSWLELGLTEQNVRGNNEKWREACNIFKDRIHARYLKHMDCIESDEFSGFAIMSLSCLLIETLEQFMRGTQDSKNEGLNYFSKFLRDNFDGAFNEKTAKIFYRKIRNGLLHNAETKDKCLINIIDENETIDKVIIIEEIDDDNIRVYRDNFYLKLKKVIDNYIEDIIKGEKLELRRNLIKKMDFICKK